MDSSISLIWWIYGLHDLYKLWTKTQWIECTLMYRPHHHVQRIIDWWWFFSLFSSSQKKYIRLSSLSLQIALCSLQKRVVSRNISSCCYVSGLRLYMQVSYQLNWREINFWRSLVPTMTQSPKSNLARSMLSKHQRLIQSMRTSEFRCFPWCWYLD